MIDPGLMVPGWNQDHLRAHRHCANNREELSQSTLCGCFYCLAVYTPAEITEWVGEEQTALCARCGIDSVIGAASGYPITTEFLQRMHDHWF
ncbi:MAG: cytoplasmic protein [Acidobacteriaceae bacterium]